MDDVVSDTIIPHHYLNDAIGYHAKPQSSEEDEYDVYSTMDHHFWISDSED